MILVLTLDNGTRIIRSCDEMRVIKDDVEQSVKDVKEEKSKILDNGMEDMKDLNEE
ncbi:hypothetical protein LF864_12830 [Enterococcus faecalis]|uniref:hypothetical protein n=1 Tax=Enterococcus faecalis TaxID=1351 RepID=UPI001CF14EE2|nr:hypothetical protein [Enterococcus faecalis]MCA6712103.1 hypothetical protein [Enterococcus faecalis]MCA6725587.1 hypothetical protein [Enterococcus faecalis]MCA6731135.1 hypothetical protein [Enterococcus faecalis]MCA6751828.1 hypothetical protein [Enterococcus faecalis]MCB5964794.1 hypothetical protein [Enterococcus faecalis]